MNLKYRLFDTSLGTMGIVAGANGLRQVYLPQPEAERVRSEIVAAYPQAVTDDTLLPELVAQLRQYLSGEPVDFDVRLDWRSHNNFEVDVWRTCRKTPYGQTQSYKGIAERLGRPGGARAVGMAMSRNPFPIVVPCHRVLKSDGGLGGYSGPGGVTFKRDLLEMEGALATT
jgi:methylated-DNA-[protein]-cysteine S-methyltransferase